MELGLLGMTENLRPVIEANPSLEILGEAKDWEFDADGNLGRIPVGEAELQATH